MYLGGISEIYESEQTHFFRGNPLFVPLPCLETARRHIQVIFWSCSDLAHASSRTRRHYILGVTSEAATASQIRDQP